MLLSIVIPCYNCEIQISKLLNSIIQQITKENKEKVEIVLINDGSSDNTKNIILKVLDKNKDINCHLINTANNGASKARDIGLQVSTGEYIFFCDSDDFISESFIEVFFDVLRDSLYFDMFYFNSIQVLSDSPDKLHNTKISFKKNGVSNDPEFFLESLLHNGTWTAAVWTYIFRRDLVNISGAKFTDRIAHEDHLFTLKILFSSKKIVYKNIELYKQVVTRGSLTNSPKNFEYINERYMAYKEASNYLVSRTSPYIRREYASWSVLAILNLYKDNKNIILMALFHSAFLRFVISDFSNILCLIYRKILKKTKI